MIHRLLIPPNSFIKLGILHDGCSKSELSVMFLLLLRALLFYVEILNGAADKNKIPATYMSVDLRSAGVLVAQQLLDIPYV